MWVRLFRKVAKAIAFCNVGKVLVERICWVMQNERLHCNHEDTLRGLRQLRRLLQ